MRRQYLWGAGSLGAASRASGHLAAGTDGTTPHRYDPRAWTCGRAGAAWARKEMVVMMFWNGGGWPFWEVALMWVGMIAFWGLLIWAVYALITSATRRTGPEPRGEEHRGDDARRILDERLARGEIDAEEYRRLRDVLASGEGRSPA